MDYKIAIDPGHGGNDSGNVGNSITEKDYALLISNYIKKRLDDLKVNNVITRNSDKNLTMPERIDVIERAYGNEDKVIVISNHLNKGNEEGLEVIYALRNTSKLASSIADSVLESGGKVNKYYQLRDPSDTSKDYYELLRDTPGYQTIIIEYGYVDNLNDANRIKNSYQNYAESVVKAIANYIEINYVPLPGTNYYVVKKGDSLYSIARNYNITVDAIKNANNLKTNILNIGQVLYLPITTKQENQNETGITYVVKKGDTLYSIARNYSVTVDAIKNANKLVTNTLQIGQKLTIPSSSNAKTIYIVKKGDTLYSIARNYNITIDSIKNDNKLVTSTLQIGQELIINK